MGQAALERLAGVIRVEKGFFKSREINTVDYDPATISVVDWGPLPLLRLFNSHGHLGWDSARWMSRT